MGTASGGDVPWTEGALRDGAARAASTGRDEHGAIVDAMPSLLASIGDEQGWSWAAAWLLDGGTLRAVATWCARPAELAHLDALARGHTVARGVGLPGRIWASGQPGWTPDVILDDDRPLAAAARHLGLRAGFAFPILQGDQVVGVLEFLGPHVRLLDVELVARMNDIGDRIAALLRRSGPAARRPARAPTAPGRTEADARRLAFLGNARALLASSIDYDGAVALLPRLATSGLADWCVLEIVTGEGRVERVAVACSDEEPEATLLATGTMAPGLPPPSLLVDEVDETALDAAFPRREQPQLVGSVGTEWLMRIPLAARGRVFGILTLLATRAGRRFGPDDQALAEELALMAAVAIDNARLRRDAEEALRLHDNFVFVSHDLRHPLSVIDLNARLIGELLGDHVAPDSEELACGLARIRRASHHMSALIREVVDLAHRHVGEPLELERRPTDLVALVRQVTEEFQRDWPARVITLSAATPSLIGPVDRSRIERVVANLLSNAIKYSRADGVVRVSVRREPTSGDRAGAAVIEVADTGVGIPRAFLPHLFFPFRRAANVEGVSGGSGIGLASAHQVVTQHHGTIAVDSVEGEGSTFTVTLPLQ
jgi:signal transduction histidine kinase